MGRYECSFSSCTGMINSEVTLVPSLFCTGFRQLSRVCPIFFPVIIFCYKFKYTKRMLIDFYQDKVEMFLFNTWVIYLNIYNNLKVLMEMIENNSSNSQQASNQSTNINMNPYKYALGSPFQMDLVQQYSSTSANPYEEWSHKLTSPTNHTINNHLDEANTRCLPQQRQQRNRPAHHAKFSKEPHYLSNKQQSSIKQSLVASLHKFIGIINKTQQSLTFSNSSNKIGQAFQKIQRSANKKIRFERETRNGGHLTAVLSTVSELVQFRSQMIKREAFTAIFEISFRNFYSIDPISKKAENSLNISDVKEYFVEDNPNLKNKHQEPNILFSKKLKKKNKHKKDDKIHCQKQKHKTKKEENNKKYLKEQKQVELEPLPIDSHIQNHQVQEINPIKMKEQSLPTIGSLPSSVGMDDVKQKLNHEDRLEKTSNDQDMKGAVQKVVTVQPQIMNKIRQNQYFPYRMQVVEAPQLVQNKRRPQQFQKQTATRSPNRPISFNGIPYSVENKSRIIHTQLVNHQKIVGQQKTVNLQRIPQQFQTQHILSPRQMLSPQRLPFNLERTLNPQPQSMYSPIYMHNTEMNLTPGKEIRTTPSIKVFQVPSEGKVHLTSPRINEVSQQKRTHQRQPSIKVAQQNYVSEYQLLRGELREDNSPIRMLADNEASLSKVISPPQFKSNLTSRPNSNNAPKKQRIQITGPSKNEYYGDLPHRHHQSRGKLSLTNISSSRQSSNMDSNFRRVVSFKQIPISDNNLNSQSDLDNQDTRSSDNKKIRRPKSMNQKIFMTLCHKR